MLHLQAQKIKSKEKLAIIAGYFIDQRTDTLTIQIDQLALGLSFAGVEKIKVPVVKGQFQVSFSIDADIAYVSIKSQNVPVLFLANYIVRPGDSNFISINNGKSINRNIENGVVFSGLNCHAFETRYKVDSGVAELGKQIIPVTYPLGAAKNDISFLWNVQFKDNDLYVERQLNELKRYSRVVDENIYNLLRADYFYQMKGYEVSEFSFEWGKRNKRVDSLLRTKVMTDYFNEYYQNLEAIFPTPMVTKLTSRNYIEFRSIITGLLPEFNDPNIRNTNCLDLIPILTQLPKGIGDKVTTILITKLVRKPATLHFDSLLNYALRSVSDERIYDLVNRYYSSSIRGSAIFAFELPDVAKKNHKIDQFKGKTVVIDFWYTGCVGCVQVSRGLKKIKEVYKNDTTVAFISISVDGTRKKWIEGLASGLYTDNGSLNLYTAEAGSDHELIRYYHINAYPQLMIVNPANRLYVFNPPRPDDLDGFQPFIDLINAAKAN